MIRMTDLSVRERKVALAWLMAGEGTFGMQRRNDNGGGMYGPFLYITNTDRTMLEQVQEVYGGKICSLGLTAKGTPIYHLRTRDHKVIRAWLIDIIDLLPTKMEQVRILLDFVERRLANPRGRYMPDDENAWRELRRLNGRRPNGTVVKEVMQG